MRRSTSLAIALVAVLCACPRSQDGAGGIDHGAHSAADHAAALRAERPAAVTGNGHDDHASLEIAPEVLQRFGVRTERALVTPLTPQIRAAGTVRTDETRESHVHVKWMGWIEEFHVAFVGQDVERGDPLFSVYSPDLIAAQQELVIAAQRLRSAGAGSRGADVDAAAQLLDAVRTKLRLWDVPETTIDEVEESGRPQRTVTVVAPRSGTVISRTAVPGLYVEPMTELYTIADLSRLWLVADLYEGEVDLVRVGDVGRFEPVPGPVDLRAVEARVAFIQPTVDLATRTVKARLELDNTDGRLRPGMFGTVVLRAPTEEVLTVPVDAVIDTGTHRVVFVRIGAGRFEPREVRTGRSAGDRVHVVEGLREGDEVVVRGQFMLDSESRLRATAGRQPALHGGH